MIDIFPALNTLVKVELPITAHLPEQYVPAERLRLEAYKRLADARSGQLIEEQQVKLGESDERQEVRFRFRPQETGVTFYRATVFTEDDRTWGEAVAVKARPNED